MIKRIINSLYFRFLAPNEFAKKAGVKFGNKCVFRTKYFGTEPYLIEIGDNFATALKVYFITHDGGLSVVRNLHEEYRNVDIFKKIVIGDNVFIGINTVILLGTKIGDNVIVGAGSVVKGNLNSNSVYAGCPAKFICTIDDYINKNKEDYDYVHSKDPIEKRSYLIQKFKSQ